MLGLRIGPHLARRGCAATAWAPHVMCPRIYCTRACHRPERGLPRGSPAQEGWGRSWAHRRGPYARQRRRRQVWACHLRSGGGADLRTARTAQHGRRRGRAWHVVKLLLHRVLSRLRRQDGQLGCSSLAYPSQWLGFHGLRLTELGFHGLGLGLGLGFGLGLRPLPRKPLHVVLVRRLVRARAIG